MGTTATGGVCDGFTAVGNFDADDQAEVVIVSAGRIFIVNHDGTVFQKNLGKATEVEAIRMRSFNPDASWKKVE